LDCLVDIITPRAYGGYPRQRWWLSHKGGYGRIEEHDSGGLVALAQAAVRLGDPFLRDPARRDGLVCPELRRIELLGPIGLTQENFAKFQGWYERYDFWIVFTCGFTPLPYKVCTISAGVARINFFGFLVASAVSRSARFFIVAGLMGWKGESIKPVIDKYFNWFSLAFVALLIGGFLVIKWVH